MMVICAWCSRDMGEKMGPDDLTTHGICDACAEQIRKHTEVCPVHGRYFPEQSKFLPAGAKGMVCPKCEAEMLDGSETLAEVNERRGYDAKRVEKDVMGMVLDMVRPPRGST